MEKSCMLCKHKEKPMGADPCLGCYREAKWSDGKLVAKLVNFEPIRACATCKYGDESLSSDPCDSCDIHFGLNKWEVKDD